MKNYPVSIILILASIFTGVVTYYTNKYFVKFYVELLPVALFSLILIIFFGKKLRRTIKPLMGLSLLSFTILIPLSVLFFLMISFPTPDMTPDLRFSDLMLRYFAIIGISVVCGIILKLFIYGSQPRSENSGMKVTE